MKLTLAALALAFGFNAVAGQNTYLPISFRKDNNQYVAFGSNFYTFTAPALQATTHTYNGVEFAAPGNITDNNVLLADAKQSGTYLIDVNTYTLSYDAARVGPGYGYVPNYSGTVTTDDQGNTYTINLRHDSPDVANITKTDSNGNLLFTTLLAQPYNLATFFSLEKGSLYVAVTIAQNRFSNDYDYYVLDASTFSITDGPVTLPATARSGCPVSPRGCGVNVLQTFTIQDGIVLWTYTKSQRPDREAFQVYVSSYTKECGLSQNTFDDAGLAPNPSGNENCTQASTQPSTQSTQSPSQSSSVRASTTRSTSTRVDGYCSSTQRQCGELCYNPARQFCCNDGTTGFFYVNGQTNPEVTCEGHGGNSAFTGATNTSGNSNGNGAGNTNGNTDGNTAGNTNANSNGNTAGNTNGNTDGNATGNTDGNTNGNTNGNTDGNTDGTNGNADGNATGNNRAQNSAVSLVLSAAALVFAAALLF